MAVESDKHSLQERFFRKSLEQQTMLKNYKYTYSQYFYIGENQAWGAEGSNPKLPKNFILPVKNIFGNVFGALKLFFPLRLLTKLQSFLLSFLRH